MQLQIARTLLIFVVFLVATSVASAGELRCDTFQAKANLEGDRLTFYLDTDCPNFAHIFVSVYRSYYEKGNQTEYARDYFEGDGPIKDWMKPRQISVAHSKWIENLKNYQKEMSPIGLGFDVGDISDYIIVRMILHINQQDPRFSRKNENLVGKAVHTDGIGLRVATSEVKIFYPLRDQEGKIFLHTPSTDPNSLEDGVSYRIRKQTPLVESPRPADPMAAIASMKYIPSGHIIEIVGQGTGSSGELWYKVIAWSPQGVRFGSGWVNAIALLGQKLEVVKR